MLLKDEVTAILQGWKNLISVIQKELMVTLSSYFISLYWK